MYDMNVSGRENIPVDGPAIIAANHKSWLDIPIVAGLTRRHTKFVAKSELHDSPGCLGTLMRYFFENMETIPVNRGGHSSSTIKGCLRELEKGNLVAIFPEGTRQYDDKIHEFSKLPESLSLKRDVPIIPVGIRGSVSPYYRERIVVRIGQPLEKHEDLQEIVALLSGYEIYEEPDPEGIDRELVW